MATSRAHEGDRLSALLDDELTDDEALVVARHVAACPPCADELDDLRRTRAALRGMPGVKAPLSFMVESVILGPPVDAEPEHVPTRAIGAVVAVSVLLVTAFALGGDVGEVTPDVDTLVGDHVETVGGGPVVVPVQLQTVDE